MCLFAEVGGTAISPPPFPKSPELGGGAANQGIPHPHMGHGKFNVGGKCREVLFCKFFSSHISTEYTALFIILFILLLEQSAIFTYDSSECFAPPCKESLPLLSFSRWDCNISMDNLSLVLRSGFPHNSLFFLANQQIKMHLRMIRSFPQNYLWFPKCMPHKTEAVFKKKRLSLWGKKSWYFCKTQNLSVWIL